MTSNRLLVLLTIALSEFEDRSQAAMEGYVVGGEYTQITRYPHSAFLAVSCVHYEKVTNWICGGSILNQHFILTAAHCLEDCLKHSIVSVSVGSEQRDLGSKSSALAIKIHELFNTRTMVNDIALVRLRTSVRFSQRVKRVAISKNPPYLETAYVAGWGLVDEDRGTGTKRLKHVRQTLWTRSECSKILHHVPVGCICAGAKNAYTNFAAAGDSGSALTVRGFIQVGIVSFKMPKQSSSLAIYTEVKLFYDWIMETTKNMFCTRKI